jgi:MinD-like ATPase involved in chromosome partitioning or flagellar assembly
MSKIVAVHSFRGGTGKSNTTANLAVALAETGQRVGIVDTDIQSPGIHILFGMTEAEQVATLNTYLWGACDITQAAYDMTARVGADIPGKIFLIPSSIKADDIGRILREGYNVGLLNDGFDTLVDDLQLDTLLVDTHPGLNEETLLSVSIADALAIVMRPDQQDYQGTSVTVEVARRLGVPRMVLVVNKVPQDYDFAAIQARVAQVYRCAVGAVLPHADEMLKLGSADIFIRRFPEHPITTTYRQLAQEMMM